MKLRLIVTLCCLATLPWLQVGCSSRPAYTSADIQPGTFEVGDRPRMLFPGASVSEVKALAMGAARSRAWTIVESTDQRLLVQRPLEAGSPLTQNLAQSGVAPGSLVEVTSHFLNEGGGVLVAMDAAVLSQTPDARQARTDATESFRPALDESLRSLHQNWQQHRGRVAQAAPPLGGSTASSDWDADDDGMASDASERRPAAWTNEAAAAIIAPTATHAATTPATAAPSPTPPVAATTPATQRPSPPTAAPVTTTAQPANPAPRAAATPRPEPRRATGQPAPVVDASPIVRGNSAPVTSQPMTLPPVAITPPEPILAPDTNLMALYPANEQTSWGYDAEQFARLRGCNVSSQGSSLVDTRSDGEIHRVPCDGADSMLIQCHNGECRGIL